MKDYNVIFNEQNFFNQPVKNNWRTCNNIPKIATGRGDDYTTSCLLEYNYFNKYYKMTAIAFSKQQAPDANLKATQQFNFTGNLNPGKNAKSRWKCKW